jgi:peptide deformylase
VNDPEQASRVALDLEDTMRFTGAHGLAAVQIGETIQMFAVLLNGEIAVFANPRILSSSGSTKTREGCLSLPGVYGIVKRPRKIAVEVTRLVRGVAQTREVLSLHGFEAVVVQHEIDHLNGVLFTDKLVAEV